VTIYTCPDGHASSTGDYCDVCGMPVVAGGGRPAAASAGPAPAGAAPGPQGAPIGSSLDLDVPAPPPLPDAGGAWVGLPTAPVPVEQPCPVCGTLNPPDNLYCEVCGYDYTTGQLPRPLDPPGGAAPAVAAPPDTGVLSFGGSGAAPAPVPVPGPGPVSTIGPPLGQAAVPASDTSAPDAAGQVLAPPVTPTSAPGHVEWVAEVWIDPDWYAAQDVADPCPSPGVPLVVPVLERTVLIGRISTSRNINPQIDISSDSGVSRRHAQLTSDGQRWWVEDLQSANGTYVGAAGEPLPSTPITAGQRVELAEDDRVYVGAWSRVVVRRATPEESKLWG